MRKMFMIPAGLLRWEMRKGIKDFFASGNTEGIYQIVCKNGEVKSIDIKAVVLSDKSIVSMWTDVTRREAAERLLKESELKFRSFFEESPEALLIFKEDALLEYNPAAQQMLRCKDKEQALKATFETLTPRKQPDDSLSSKRVREAIDAARLNKNYNFEWTMKRFDGELFSAEISITEVTRSGRKLLLVVLRDVTALKEAEKALLRMKDELEDQVSVRTSELAALNEELQKAREELRSLSEHLQQAREEERTRIAREVHDELGQLLTALKMDLAFHGQSLTGGNNTLTHQTKEMEKQIDGTIQAVRDICAELRPHVLDHLGLPAGIKWYVKDFQKRTGIFCTARIYKGVPAIRNDLSIVFFRILQEAMTNVLRHAGATAVQIVLKNRGPDLTLKVNDNGKGITQDEIANPLSYGIIGIQERVRFWGGRSVFEGTPNKGTTMTISIPLTGENTNERRHLHRSKG